MELLTGVTLADPTWRRLVMLLGRRRFDLARGSDLVDWGVDALLAGWESQSLNVLAGLWKPPDELEVDHYVERMMRELGVEMPAAAELPKLYGIAVAREMLARTITPRDGARELLGLWIKTGCPKDREFWGVYEDAYDHIGVYRDVADVDRDILDEARRMVGEQDNRA
jgi:hypothetical protein